MKPPPACRLTPEAVEDLRATLRRTGTRFGTHQRTLYAQQIAAALRLIAEEPERPGSVSRSDIGLGFRSFPVWLAARRKRSSPHVLFYAREAAGVVLLRILHEAMDPVRHLGPADDA